MCRPVGRLYASHPQRSDQSAARRRPRQVDAALEPQTFRTNYDDTVVALSFSGGGTRAAAFSYGVSTGFDQTRVPNRSGPVSLLDRLDFLSGVSGGSVLAAYYGLKGREALGDFKQRFLDVMPRRGCRPSSASPISPAACKAASTTPAHFRLARRPSLQSRDFRDLLAVRRPRVWINASDIYNRTAFIFAPRDVRRAVQRSLDLPGVAGGRGFRRRAGGVRPDCHSQLSRRLPGRRCRAGCSARAQQPQAPPLIQAYADALERYRSGESNT